MKTNTTLKEIVENSIQDYFNALNTAWENFYIKINIPDTEKRYADSIGVNVDNLTEKQRRQAYFNKIMGDENV